MKPSSNSLLIASVLLPSAVAHATDYNWGSITQNFTIARTDWARDVGGSTSNFNNANTGDMGIYWRGSASDRTYFHFDLSTLAGTTINGDVSLNATVKANWGGVCTGSTINTVNAAWTASTSGTAQALTPITGATNATGDFATGDTATWVIPGATFSTYIGSPTFYGLGLEGVSGTTAHFSGTSTLTGSYTGGLVRVTGGTNWGAVSWNAGTNTATLASADASGGDLVIDTGGTFALTGSGTLDSGTFSGTIRNAGTLSIGSSANQTLGGVISGSGGITKSGDGTLSLTTVNSFAGVIDVNAGTLEAKAATSGSASAIGNGANTINIAQGATLLFSTNDRAAGYHSGTVNLNGGTITFNTADSSLASGKSLTFDTTPGTINGSGQWRRRDGNNKVVVTAAASGSTISVADLNLKDSNPVFEVADGAQSADLTISSGVSGDSSLTKTGAGTLLVAGTVTAPITVNVGVLELGGAGTLSLGSKSLVISNVSGSHGIFNQTGGTATLGVGGWTGVGNNSTGAVNLSGGLFDSAAREMVVGVRGNSSLTVSGTADVRISTVQILHSDAVTGSGKTGTVNLDGGSLQAGSVSRGTTLSTSILNFNGGTLKAAADTTTFIQGLTRANVRDGGAAIDTNGFDVTIAQALEHSDIGGDGAIDGGLTKTGEGTLILTGTSTYTGATTVSVGTMLVSGALGNTAVSVAAGAAMGGSGTIAGDVAFASDSFFDIHLAIDNPLDVGGTVTFGSGASLFGIDNLTGISWLDVADGTHTLINGTVNTANLDNLDLANAASIGGGRFAYFEEGSLKLVVIPEPSVFLLGGLGTLALLRRRRS